MRIGNTVSFVRRNGEKAQGKVVDIQKGSTGDFLHVNVGDKKNPKITKIRPSQATKV